MYCIFHCMCVWGGGGGPHSLHTSIPLQKQITPRPALLHLPPPTCTHHSKSAPLWFPNRLILLQYIPTLHSGSTLGDTAAAKVFGHNATIWTPLDTQCYRPVICVLIANLWITGCWGPVSSEGENFVNVLVRGPIVRKWVGHQSILVLLVLHSKVWTKFSHLSSFFERRTVKVTLMF